jgi:hypothetical protein
LITTHDIELCTTAVYKEAIWEIAFKDDLGVGLKPQSAKRTLQEALKEVKTTSLMGFRDFTFDTSVEKGLRREV